MNAEKLPNNALKNNLDKFHLNSVQNESGDAGDAGDVDLLLFL